MSDVIISDEYGNQVPCHYGADAQEFLEGHKYSKHGIKQKLKCNFRAKCEALPV